MTRTREENAVDMMAEETARLEEYKTAFTLCTFIPSSPAGAEAPVKGDQGNAWVVDAEEFTRLAGFSPRVALEQPDSFSPTSLRFAKSAPDYVKNWTGSYTIECQYLVGARSFAEVRKDVADDLYENVTNDSSARSMLVEDYIRNISDAEIAELWISAELGEEL